MATLKRLRRTKNQVQEPEPEVEQGQHIESVTLGDLTWTNIEGPTTKEIEYLAQNYQFHPLDLDDCLSRKQRPKIDQYKEYLFLVFHFPVFDKETRITHPSQVSIFIGDNYLITLHTGELKPLTKLFRECQIDEQSREKYLSQGSGYLLYTVTDRLVDYCMPILDKILEWVENVEDSVFDESIVAAPELSVLRRDIITQRRIVFPLRTVIGELGTKSKRFTKEDLSVYYGDLMDHMNKICETLDECKEIIEVFKDTDYLLSTEHLNSIVHVLTILSSILLPFLIISSFYGMNIPLPGGIERGSPVSFILLLASMCLASGGMLYFFRRKHWI